MPRYNNAGCRKQYTLPGEAHPNDPEQDWSGPTQTPIFMRKARNRRANAIARISRKRNRGRR